MKARLRVIQGGDPADASVAPRRAPAERDPLVDVANPRHRAALELLEAGYTRATTADGFRTYLRVVSRLWHFSPRNVGLVYAQRPDATMVASYRRWRELGRQVRQGEQGIRIFFPYRRMDLDPVSGEEHEVVAGFGLGAIFDVKQTDGDPLPEPPTPSDRFGTTAVAAEVDRRLSLWLLGRGFRLEKKGTTVGFSMGPRGYFMAPDAIVLADFLADNDGKAKTLLHEAAHAVAKHHEQGEPWEDKPRKEIEAEGAAFAALQHFGVDTGDYSFPYLARWGKGQDAIRRALPEIARVAQILVSAIEGEHPDGEEAWL